MSTSNPTLLRQSARRIEAARLKQPAGPVQQRSDIRLAAGAVISGPGKIGFAGDVQLRVLRRQKTCLEKRLRELTKKLSEAEQGLAVIRWARRLARHDGQWERIQLRRAVTRLDRTEKKFPAKLADKIDWLLTHSSVWEGYPSDRATDEKIFAAMREDGLFHPRARLKSVNIERLVSLARRQRRQEFVEDNAGFKRKEVR